MSGGVQITGLEQVQRRLKEVPSLLAAKAMHTALDRGIGVIAGEVEALTPEFTGDLAEHVITDVEVNAHGGNAVVGFSSAVDPRTGKPNDAKALWVEFGHELVSHDGKHIGHVPAHPFMRTAFESSAERAIAVFADVLIEGLSVIEAGE